MATFVESFTGSDSASLAAADIDLTWSDVVAGWSVASNRAVIGSSDAVTYARAEHDTGSSDMWAQVTLVDKTDGGDITQCALLARYSASDNSCYMLCRGQDDPNDINLRRTVSGARSTIATATHPYAAGEVLRLEVEGTSIRGYIDGVLRVSATDSVITSGQRAGIYGYRDASGAGMFDAFSTGLLGAVKAFAAVIGAASEASGALARARGLSGLVPAAQALPSAPVSRARGVAAVVAAAGDAAAGLGRTRGVAAVLGAAVDLAGGLGRDRGLAAAAAAAAELQGSAAGRDRGFAAVVATAAQADGSAIVRDRGLVSSLAAAADLHGLLGRGRQLAALLGVATELRGDFTTSVATGDVPALPWLLPAVRAVLLEDPRTVALVGSRISTRLPADVTRPCVTLQASTVPIDASAGAWLPLVQVDAWCPPTHSADPERTVWDIAAAAAAALSRIRNRRYQSCWFSARITDGPIPDVDTSRGQGNPVYRALIRAELLVHARP